MPSDYLIQVVHKASGSVVQWEPGLRLEQEFEDELLLRVKAKGVGLTRTEIHVLADIRAAVRELLYDLKSRV